MNEYLITLIICGILTVFNVTLYFMIDSCCRKTLKLLKERVLND